MARYIVAKIIWEEMQNIPILGTWDGRYDQGEYGNV
jgi:hypothetical protein